MTTATRLVITPGEPAGIGPDVCIQLVQEVVPAAIVFVADPDVIQQRARQLNLRLEITTYESAQDVPQHQAGHFPVIPVTTQSPVTAGQLSTSNAPYVIKTLERALSLVTDGPFDALVTAPVHKGIINDAGIAFTGHTEWLAQHTGSELPVMMLATASLRVALVTTHLPLSEVSQAITSSRLQNIIRILHNDLQAKFHLDKPRIRVCGLNPHAGENGHLGTEEQQVIQPVLERLRQEGMHLEGPVPADTAFLPDSLGATDAILAMYHDQGLPVLKYSGFDEAVNITLGLPVVRTSVDHGTALEIAGTGKASASSLAAAVNVAIHMAGGHG